MSQDTPPSAAAADDERAGAPDGGGGQAGDVQPRHDGPGFQQAQDRYQIGEQDEQGKRRLVLDRVLDRQSIARVVPLNEADALEREARVLAHIDHAGVPAVLDLQRGDTWAMLVLRKTDGITLSEAVARAQAGAPPTELSSPAAVAQVMVRVCAALGAAHARGVAHCNVTPDCVLLGWQGQVIVQDWDRAMGDGARPQGLAASATAPDGLHQDIRGVGSCLFTALALRPPNPSGKDPVEPLGDDERRRVPANLLSVARRALHTDAAGGYADMAALEADLTRIIEGQAPSDERRGWLGRLAERCRVHAVALVVALAVLAAVAAVVLPGLRQRWAWGVPVVSEDFSDNSWTSRWMEPSFHGSMFRVQNERLVSTAVRGADLIYRQVLTVPVAIEYTGEILNGSTPCDLSVNWYSNVGEPGDSIIPAGSRTYNLQFGGLSNLGIVLNRSGDRLPVAFNPEKLEVGRLYRFRVEIDEESIVMMMDGRRVIEYHDLAGFTSGCLALYAHFPGKAFDDVRIYQKEPRRLQPPTSLGDHFLRRRKFDEAVRLYDLVVQEHGVRPEGQQALFRKGVALWLLGRRSEALGCWSKVADPALADSIEAYVFLAYAAERQAESCRRFTERWQAEPAQRPALLELWTSIVRNLAAEASPDAALVDRVLELRSRLFAQDGMTAHFASGLLQAHARYEDCLRMFPGDRNATSVCLLALGRSRELIAVGWANGDSLVKAWQMQGDFAKIPKESNVMPVFASLALCKLGRAEEALADPRQRYPALLHLGRAHELIGDRELSASQSNEVLISCGRLAEAAGAGAAEFPRSGNDAISQLLLGDLDAVERSGKTGTTPYRFMMAVEAGDEKAVEQLRPLVLPPKDLRYHSGWFTAFIVRPLTDRWRGDAGALEQQLRPRLELFSGIYGKRPWYVARAMLGEIAPEALKDMPAVSEAVAWQYLVTGICSELAGKPAEAKDAYQAFSKLPVHQRLLALNTPDPEIEWFVRWRLRALGG